ncbi:maleylacetoacetate isomerase [Telluria beijingensis]|uniref:maleylacetoacetate isomerase n=1 Tax=Telluria beijingensis TaxID=3068633 RepID=UPI00279637CD|nr:maleylacetoacetate isomerase [Massilia sp. REN29]
MRLHTYFRSSTAYRVRIALGLKGIQAGQLPVDLLKEGGEQFGAAYDALNPQHLVPLLEDGGMLLAQSLAIIEYLDEAYPGPALLPPDLRGRARVRSLSLAIACDIHPLNNLRVLKYLRRELKVAQEGRDAWYRHWIALGLGALERQLVGAPETGLFCHGDTPTMLDCCLVPQLANARGNGCDLDPYPTLLAIAARCEAIEAFAAARPERQPDAP